MFDKKNTAMMLQPVYHMMPCYNRKNSKGFTSLDKIKSALLISQLKYQLLEELVLEEASFYTI